MTVTGLGMTMATMGTSLMPHPSLLQPLQRVGGGCENLIVQRERAQEELLSAQTGASLGGVFVPLVAGAVVTAALWNRIPTPLRGPEGKDLRLFQKGNRLATLSRFAGPMLLVGLLGYAIGRFTDVTLPAPVESARTYCEAQERNLERTEALIERTRAKRWGRLFTSLNASILLGGLILRPLGSALSRRLSKKPAEGGPHA